MQSILHITGPADPLTKKISLAAQGRFEIETVDGNAVPASLASFDAVLIGDTPLSSPLPTSNGEKPGLIQLTRGHHRHIDVPALTAAGITVAGASPVLAAHIAAHAFGLAIAARAHGGARGIQDRETIAAMRESDLSGVTAGIVGFGRIGRAMAERCAAAGAKVVYSDIRTATHGSTAASGARRLTLDLLLSQSDIVSLHVQWGPTSNPLVTGRELRLMGRDSVLVNTADARLMDASALAKALHDGRLGGAGLDIEDPGYAQLARQPNAVVTPYTAARSDAADTAVAEFVVENIGKTLSGHKPDGLIEIVDYPRAGDPAFWSSKMAPRT